MNHIIVCEWEPLHKMSPRVQLTDKKTFKQEYQEESQSEKITWKTKVVMGGGGGVKSKNAIQKLKFESAKLVLYKKQFKDSLAKQFRTIKISAEIHQILLSQFSGVMKKSVKSKLMRIELSNREGPFLRLIIISQLRTKTLVWTWLTSTMKTFVWTWSTSTTELFMVEVRLMFSSRPSFLNYQSF